MSISSGSNPQMSSVSPPPPEDAATDSSQQSLATSVEMEMEIPEYADGVEVLANAETLKAAGLPVPPYPIMEAILKFRKKCKSGW